MERVQRWKEMRERHPDTERKIQKRKGQRGKERGKKGERERQRESPPHRQYRGKEPGEGQKYPAVPAKRNRNAKTQSYKEKDRIYRELMSKQM